MGKCEVKCSPIEDQIETVIIPARQKTARQYVVYANELKCSPEFVTLMLRDIADTFEDRAPKIDNSCDCC